MIHTRIQGIPCQITMTAGTHRQPCDTWASADDYYGGWIGVQFEVYDRTGRRALWLEKKITAADEERIIQELTA